MVRESKRPQHPQLLLQLPFWEESKWDFPMFYKEISIKSSINDGVSLPHWIWLDLRSQSKLQDRLKPLRGHSPVETQVCDQEPACGLSAHVITVARSFQLTHEAINEGEARLSLDPPGNKTRHFLSWLQGLSQSGGWFFSLWPFVWSLWVQICSCLLAKIIKICWYRCPFSWPKNPNLVAGKYLCPRILSYRCVPNFVGTEFHSEFHEILGLFPLVDKASGLTGRGHLIITNRSGSITIITSMIINKGLEHHHLLSHMFDVQKRPVHDR